jgi:primosomal protein N' (replication factor Y)
VAGRVVRVLPDEPAIAKTFDYLVPDELGDQVRVGTRVRVDLGGRRVSGWIVELDVAPPPGVTPRRVAKLSGWGPTPDLIDLAHWAAWRWSGRPAALLRTANPERNVPALPAAPPRQSRPPTTDPFYTTLFATSPAPPVPEPDPEPGADREPEPAGVGGEPDLGDWWDEDGDWDLGHGDVDGGDEAWGGLFAPAGDDEAPGDDDRLDPEPADLRQIGLFDGIDQAGRPLTGPEAWSDASGGAHEVEGQVGLFDGLAPPTPSTPPTAGAPPTGPPTDLEAPTPWFDRPVAVGPWATDTPRPGPGPATGLDTQGRAVLRLPPAADPAEVALAAAARGNALVVCPNVELARHVGRRLRRAGVPVAAHPREWALGAAGATVVGTRAAAWAPVGDLAAVVVVDEHDEGHAQEQTPTWNARDVAAERARRAGVPCVLVSPCPSLEAQAWGPLTVLSRNDERAGWPLVDVVDRRRDDPRTGLVSPRLVDVLRSDRRVLCVLNRVGRARLLACSACGELARCEACDAALSQLEAGRLACPRCHRERPQVCAACGATRLKLLRQGVSRVREELEALVGEPVGEVSSLKDGPAAAAIAHAARVVVGTEAVLHQAGRADAVAFLDLDQELLAPRYRAAEQALGLLARAARLVGGRDGGGRLVLQTRAPRHEAVLAALHADPTRVAEAEAERRRLLRFPPAAALAEVSGAAAGAFVEALGRPPGVDVMGPADGRWLLRAPDHPTLCDALAATPRPPGRLRLSVDPLRV